MLRLNQIRKKIQAPVKKAAFSAVRGAHKRFAFKPLPDRLGIYFHALGAHQRAAFRACVDILRGEGYEAVSVDDYISPENNGRRQFFLSFDDNYKSWYDSLPLFDELDVKVTFYTNTLPFRDTANLQEISAYFDRVVHFGDRTPLSRQELKDIHAAGHTIAAHTHSHPVLSKLSRDKWDDEILQSKTILEDLVGEEVRHFAYPFGMRRFFSHELRTYCLENGFETIAAAIPGMQYAQPFDQSCLHRSPWVAHRPTVQMIEDLCIDGRLFEKLTGRSAVG